MQNQSVVIHFEGQQLSGEYGDTIAHIMLSHNIWQFSNSETPRGPFCNMGVCYDCQLLLQHSVTGQQLVRTCLTLAEDGMQLSRVDSWHS